MRTGGRCRRCGRRRGVCGCCSIVSQGVRSTICALWYRVASPWRALCRSARSFAAFKPDDLELISAVAAQTRLLLKMPGPRTSGARGGCEANTAGFFRVRRQAELEILILQTRRCQPNYYRALCDIRDYTPLRTCTPGKDCGLLNRYFSAMTTSFRARWDA